MKSLTEKATPVGKIKTTLKRRVGYMEEQVSITRAKIEKMEICEDTEAIQERGKDRTEEMDEFEENIATTS